MESVFGKSREELSELIGSQTRAGRVFRSIYRNGVDSFDSIRGIPSKCRSVLAGSLSIELPHIDRHFESGDGTRRYLVRLSDNETVESVLIPGADRETFCISSQIGCALGCTFCLTGQMGLVRDLTAAEIVAQAIVLRKEARSSRFSVVLMGMGEPLQNYDNVLNAIRILHDDCGLAIPATRITLSTAGLVPGIQRLATELVFPNLSISLTGVRNASRDLLMPINRRYPIEKIMDAVRTLPPSRQGRVMFECVMIAGLTDSPDDAHELARLLRDMRAKVNLIPLNPAPEIPFERSSDAAVLRFQEILVNSGTATFVRKNRGNDVSGACGQLKKKVLVSSSSGGSANDRLR